MPTNGYKTVKDSDLNIVWECENCVSKADISPEWYQNNGTPVCHECDIDMIYIRTEIKKHWENTLK